MKSVLLAIAATVSTAAIFAALMLVGEPKPYPMHQIVKYAVVGGIMGLVFFLLHLQQKVRQ